MDSGAEPGHLPRVLHIHVFSTIRPCPQEGVRGTRSSGPCDQVLLPRIKPAAFFVGLLSAYVFQGTPSAFLENLNIPGLLTYLS